jgi:hypothetical protein
VRKYFTALFVCVVAGVLAVLAAGVQVAQATSSACKANTPYDMGYVPGTAPGSGGSIGAVISLSSGSHRYSGSMRGFIEVSDAYDESNNLIVGIRDVGSGAQLYVENDGSFSGVTNVSMGPGYSVYLDHGSGNNWTAWWYNGVYNYHLSVTISGTPVSIYEAHTQTTDSTCNQFVYGFTSVSPYSLGSMGETDNSSGIYLINPLSSSSFTVYGPNR